MGARKRFAPEEDALIRAHYPTEGLACAGRLPGRDAATVHNRALLLGLESRHPRRDKYDWTPLEPLYHAGMPAQRIARELGIPVRIVANEIIKRGLAEVREMVWQDILQSAGQETV